jgi:hypothetical protein
MSIRKLWARITRKGSEEGVYPIQQVTYLGRVSDAIILFPYGMHANLPVDQLGLLIDDKGRVFIGTSAVGRITVEEGEVVFYHPATKSKTHYKNNGDIDIDTVSPDVEESAHGNVNISTKNVNITNSEKVTVNSTGDVDITTSGDANVDATNVNIDAVVNLGVGGAAIARVGDAVSVTVVGGSSAGVHTGVITSGGANTSL